MRVLLALPSGPDRAALADRFEAEGIDVAVAGDGREAMRRLESAPPDVAVVERSPAGIDGADLAGWIRDHRTLHALPVILLVERDELHAAAGSLAECAATDVQVKPVEAGELLLRVRLRASPDPHLPHLFTGRDIDRLGVQEQVVRFLAQYREREEEVMGLFLTDPETGLFNRAYFKIKLSEELKRARRYGQPLSALLIKLAPGPGSAGQTAAPASAMTLKEIAGILLLESRDLDVLGRYGPSDFSLVLPATGQDGALLLAQRISESIITHRFSDNHGGRDFLVRIGLATYPVPGIQTPEDLMNRAYDALVKAESYGAKEICIWESKAGS